MQSQLFLNDAREHQQASLEIVSLLLSHGANPDEAYTPVRQGIHDTAAAGFCAIRSSRVCLLVLAPLVSEACLSCVQGFDLSECIVVCILTFNKQQSWLCGTTTVQCWP